MRRGAAVDGAIIGDGGGIGIFDGATAASVVIAPARATTVDVSRKNGPVATLCLRERREGLSSATGGRAGRTAGEARGSRHASCHRRKSIAEPLGRSPDSEGANRRLADSRPLQPSPAVGRVVYSKRRTFTHSGGTAPDFHRSSPLCPRGHPRQGGILAHRTWHGSPHGRVLTSSLALALDTKVHGRRFRHESGVRGNPVRRHARPFRS
jgi:hypothetical protein